ncbi:hypothetical protein [Neorhizobium sp. T7_12]|uniref:hypothetical protein n=1 Tax=Neorhizobium sp. T7_12 TaxID=2093832 RepID=UPI00155EDFE7|nr:hypothetical protein [Neorhizobium sp. T7_12]
MQIVGRSAVSLLSDSLKLYLKALERQVEFHLGEEEKATAKKNGFIAAYKMALGKALDIDWAKCPVRFDVIEQIVLTRNRVQHGDSLWALSARYDPPTLTKHRNLIFANDSELETWMNDGADPGTWLAPQVTITKESLDVAVAEVEKLGDWIEAQIQKIDVRRRSASISYETGK